MFKGFRNRLAVLAILAAGAFGSARAQILGWDVCSDPMNTAPISADASATNPLILTNGIMSVFIGLSGSYTFGPNSPCSLPGGLITNDSLAIPGSINFTTGFNFDTFQGGSALAFDDDFVAITPAIINNINTNPPPPPPFVNFVGGRRYSYVTIRSVDTEGTASDAIWGENGFELVVEPNASFRRMTLEDRGLTGGVDAKLIVDDIGGSLRFEWTLRNTNATQRSIGLRYMGAIRMRSFSDDNFFGGFPEAGRVPFILTPRGRPITIDTEWNYLTNPNSFPKFFDFYMAQSFPYPSVRFITGKTDQHKDQEQVTRFTIGGETTGTLWDAVVIPDSFHSGVMYMWFDPVPVAGGASRKLVFYVDPPWAVTDAALPYGLTTETDFLRSYSPGSTNDLNPNPGTVVAYVDNQFARINQSVTIASADLTLYLTRGASPDNDPKLPVISPLSLSGGDPALKQMFNILPNQQQQTTWSVEADGLESGIFPYRIDVNPSVGPKKKIYGQIAIGLTTQMDLKAYSYKAQLVSFPWLFGDSSFGALGFPGGSSCFTYDGVTGQYVAATTVDRGKGYWVKYTGADPAPFALNGAFPAGDKTFGDFSQTLTRGWNLIGNPYPYPVQLNQLIAVSDADPTQTYTWAEVASRNWVRSTWFRQNRDASASTNSSPGAYSFSSDDTQLITPSVGYWVFVNSYDRIQLFWPAVYAPGLPGSFNMARWGSSPGDWGVTVNVSGSGVNDAMAALGYASNANEASSLTSTRPPSAPGAAPAVEAEFVRQSMGITTRWAHDIRTGEGTTQKYTLAVKMNRGGSYTLTWPEVANLPKNVRLTIKDLMTGQVRSMTSTSSLTISSAFTTTRRFEITAKTN